MSTDYEATSRQRRPFIGFDRERDAFKGHHQELLESSAGKYVVLVGDRMIGTFETEDEAERAGFEAFGPGPLYIKQVLTVEPVVELRPGVIPCRS